MPTRHRASYRRSGHHPYVTDSGLQTVGVGPFEVMPRRVLVVQENELDVSIDDSVGVRFLSMPLNYLGYRVDFAETRDTLPEITPDRYAGVVVWTNGNIRQNPGRFYAWAEKQIRQGIPVVFMNGFGAQPDGALARMLDLKVVKGRTSGDVQIVSQDKMMGFEQQWPRTVPMRCQCRYAMARRTRARCCACARAR
jgi:hypothetical protein